MNHLAIDIETFSDVDITKSGVYKYAESPAFEILLFGYSVNDNPVHVIDLKSGEEIPASVLNALFDVNYKKSAWNANFERVCITKHLGKSLPVNQWECTMAKASMLGLPLGLDAAAKTLGIENGKLASGKALIRYFTMPCKPTKTNGMRTRNLPEHALEKWKEFIEYDRQDVVVEKEINHKIKFFSIPAYEKRLYEIDQHINDNGILLDRLFINRALKIDFDYRKTLTEKAIQLTGLDNPNSAAQLKQWLSVEMGDEVTSLKKDDIPALLESTDNTIITSVLNIRKEMAKTSIKKYASMLVGISKDDRLRGIHQYYGAGRTGRWAGRRVQPQNLPKNSLKDLDLARQVVRSGDGELLEMLFGNIPDTLSQLIRTAFVAAENSRFGVADFAAIEARIIAWLASEKWRLDVFNTHGEIYEASASKMFKVPIESIFFKNKKGEKIKGPNYHLRANGKVAELALGFGGGPNALIKMGALNMGILEEELPKLVKMWRNANPGIVQLWRTVEDAAINCMVEQRPVQIMHNIRFTVENDVLFIELPSKRKLAYMKPRLKTLMMVFVMCKTDFQSFKKGQKYLLPTATADRFHAAGKIEYGSEPFEKQSITYEGLDQDTKQWKRIDTYGGKLVENIVQGIARDCLAEAIVRLHDAKYRVVLHVHDEVVLEMPNGTGSLQEINAIMSKPMPWAPQLPLGAESYETIYYKKD